MKKVTLDFDKHVPMYGKEKGGWVSSMRAKEDKFEVRTAYRSTWIIEDCGPAVRRRYAVVKRYKDLESGKVWYSRGKYTTWEAAPGANTDICSYCGANNGPHSEGRSGWDCGWCGGN